MLKEMRDVEKMTPEKRAAYHGEAVPSLLTGPDTQLFRDALRDLSDSQIAALVAGEKIYLDPSRYADQVALFRDRWNTVMQKDRQTLVQNGTPVGPMPNPPPPSIAIVPQGVDGSHPSWVGMFGIAVEGISTVQDGQYPGMPIIEPYRQNSQVASAEAIKQLASEPGPTLDLAPALYLGIRPDKDTSEALRRRRDLAELLRALAKITHANVYEEHFVKNAFAGDYQRYSGLAKLKGTRGQLLADISWDFNVRFQKVGDDYYVWSNTWAQDRLGDIPEPALTFWRERDKAQNGFTLRDRARAASSFSLAQLRQTFSEVIPDWGDSLDKGDYVVLQALGQLTTAQWDVLARGQSVSLTEVSPNVIQTLSIRYPDLTTKHGPLNLTVSCSAPDQFLQKPCTLFRVAVVSDEATDNTTDISGWLAAPAKFAVLWNIHEF